MIILVHAVAASFVLALGPVQILRKRRDRAHRIIGFTWYGAMLATCFSSFGIHPHGFSWLHGLAIFTIITSTLGVVGAIRHNRGMHKRNMVGSYLGTCIAFVFASLMPDRMIAQMAVHDPLSLLAAAALIVATAGAFIWSVLTLTVHKRRRRPHGRGAGVSAPARRRSTASRGVGV